MKDLRNEIKDFEKEFYKLFFETLATDECGNRNIWRMEFSVSTQLSFCPYV